MLEQPRTRLIRAGLRRAPLIARLAWRFRRLLVFALFGRFAIARRGLVWALRTFARRRVVRAGASVAAFLLRRRSRRFRAAGLRRRSLSRS